jgi:anaerobic selenocysteine-containing dehydrogenase
VINALTGNLDRPGGAMFAKAAAGAANTRGRTGSGRAPKFGRWHSRVRQLPEMFGELPAVCLPEEIDTPGPGRLRALVTVAGNPVLSTPDGDRLDRALAGLDAMISVDAYVNETTRHAHLILPPPSPMRRGHYDVFLSQLALRNVARYSPPVLAPQPGRPEEWEILARLALIARGDGPAASPDRVAEEVVGSLLSAAAADESSVVAGQDAARLVETVFRGGERRGTEAVLDAMLRTGPYGDGFGANPGGLCLDELLDHPHGIDLGPLDERIPEVLRTPTGRVDLAPAALLADVPRLAAAMAAGADGPRLVLVGRRHLRSNNSWMHNLTILMKGKPRCTLLVHPDDAHRLGLTDGKPAEISAAGNGSGWLTVPVEVTDAVRPGVVSLPHGWGHDRPGVRLSVASVTPGVNVNLLAAGTLFDPLSGTAVLNGLPVEVRSPS